MAKLGWDVKIDGTYYVECCEGKPYTRKKAIPQCARENLIKFYRLVNWEGDLTKMVFVLCTD